MYTSPFGVVVDPGAAFTTASAMNRSAPPNRQPAFANASTGPTTVKINHRRHMGNSPRGMFGRRPNEETVTAEQSGVTLRSTPAATKACSRCAVDLLSLVSVWATFSYEADEPRKGRATISKRL